MSRFVLLCLFSLQLEAGDAAWADRSGSDATGAWAEIDAGGVALRFRWRTFARGEQVWLGEAPVPPAAIKALIPDIPDPRSLRWRGAWRIADHFALCAAIERGRRIRCMLPRLAWLRETFPQPRPDWPRLWTGDLVSGLVAFAPMLGARCDDLLASRLWGPPWSEAELVEPPFPERGDNEFSDEDRYAHGLEHPLSQPTWVRPVDRIGRGNDGDTPLAALRRVLKPGEEKAAGEPEGAPLGIVLAVIAVSGPGERTDAPVVPADGLEPLLAPGHRNSGNDVESLVAPDAGLALTNGDSVRLWDLGRWVARGPLRRPDGEPYAAGHLAWSADGATLFTAGSFEDANEGELIAWDAWAMRPRWRRSFAVDQAHWTGYAMGQLHNHVSNRALLLADEGRLLRLVQQRGMEGASGSWSLWFDAATGEPATAERVPWQVADDGPYTVTRSSDGVALPHRWERLPVAAERPGEIAVCDGATFRRWRLPDLAPLGSIDLPNVDLPPHEEALLVPAPDGRRWLFHDGRQYAWLIDVAAGTAVQHFLGEQVILSSPAPGELAVRGDVSLDELPAELAAGFRVTYRGAIPAARARGLAVELDGGALRLREGNGGTELAALPVLALRLAGLSFAGPRELVLDAAGRRWRLDLASLAVASEPSEAEPTYRSGDEALTVPGDDGGTWTVAGYGGWSHRGEDGTEGRQLPPDPRWRQGGSPEAAATAAGIFVASNGRDLVCRERDGALRWWGDAGEPPDGRVSLIAVSPDGRLIATFGSTVALRRASDGALLCRIAPAAGGPIPFTADGHYAARGDPGSSVAFRWQGEVWPVTEFDLQRNRPDVVAAAIGLADGPTIAALRRAWEGRCRRIGVSPSAAGAVTKLPRVMIDRAALPLAVDGSSIDLTVRVADAPAGSSLVVRLDEVPVPSRQGSPISGPLERRTLALLPGLNRIAVSVRLADGREGLRDSAWVVCRATAAPPRVHVLAVGCGRYRQAGLDLDFAAKDARDLAAALKPATAAVVLDQEATRAGIAAAAARLRGAAPQDVVVVFLAGHGVLDEAGGYWFLTHDADPRAPSARALSYAAIEDLLEAVPARRRLVLLDTCHAGEVDGEGLVAVAAPGTAPGVRARGLRAWKTSAAPRGFDFLDLRSGVGAAVLASSAGLEFAYESSDWANGVFTLAVLEGWARGAADGNADQTVRVGELAAYVSRRVQALTGGTQNPALRSLNRSVDAVLPR